jgi:hypothetical protein
MKHGQENKQKFQNLCILKTFRLLFRLRFCNILIYNAIASMQIILFFHLFNNEK